MTLSTGGDHRRVRVLRVIARMNIGGPAHHVSLLSGRLDPKRYETLLVVGRPASQEGCFDDLARQQGARVVTLDALGPDIHLLRDLRALLGLVRITRRFRPDIVHTHTAKAGFLGRAAALGSGRSRPVVLHTFHGHVLEGYFGGLKSFVFRLLERRLARYSDRLLAVSEATARDLVRLGVAPRSKIAVVPLGLDLDSLKACTPGMGSMFRRELGLTGSELLVVSLGRLVPIKRLDVLLRGFSLATSRGFGGHLAVIGDGSERSQLEALVLELDLVGRVTFTGFRTDLMPILSAANLVALTSDNEGTPVSLIEAAAAGVPALATSVGGVPEVVAEATGVLVAPNDPSAVAEALVSLCADKERLAAMGSRAREGTARWSVERLLGDVDRHYSDLLESSWRRACSSGGGCVNPYHQSRGAG